MSEQLDTAVEAVAGLLDGLETVNLSSSDMEFVELAAHAHVGTLDRSPKKNWVENVGGLPTEIEHLAEDLHKKGMTISRAIATAVSRAKYWAATSKNAKTKAKWAAEVAAWEAKKAKSHAQSAAKKGH